MAKLNNELFEPLLLPSRDGFVVIIPINAVQLLLSDFYTYICGQ